MRLAGARLWIGAALLATAGAAAAQAPDPGAAPPEPEDGSGVVCIVSGYDIVFRNEGTAPIPGDTMLEWEVPFARMNGSHRLSAPLDPGGQLFQTAVLGSSYLGPRTPCHARVATGDAESESLTESDEEAVPTARSP